MTLLDEARDLIRDYLDAHESRKISTLAKRAGVPYSTVRRVVQGESTSVRGETLVPILSVFMEEQAIQALLVKHATGKNKEFAEVLLEGSYRQIPHESGEEILWELPDVYIMALANTRSGVAQDQVAKMFGEYGIDRLEHLVEKEIIVRDGNRFRTFKDNFFDNAPNSVVGRVKALGTAVAQRADKGSIYQYWMHPMSKDQWELIKEETRIYRQKITEIAKAPTNAPKDDAFMVGLVIDKVEQEGNGQ